MPAITIISQQSSKISSSLLSAEIAELHQSSSPSSSLSWGCQVYATRRNLFVSAIVDSRPSKAVHCPNLNACLVNESRSEYVQVNCQTIHFGYAIPINIVPVRKNPELVELVLDQSVELSNRVVNFLLNHHPQLCQQKQGFYDMAATAKHDLRRKFPADTSASGEEDIAAIAKQISDHAEAIYQTWKSRGLAPTEILTCHSNTIAADKFGSALTPCNSPIGNAVTGNNIGGKTSPSSLEHSSPTTVDILSQTPNLDNGNLEKLVNNFVVEDKARIAASKQRSPSKPLPSSIQFALQKFERNSTQQQTSTTKNNIIPDNSKKLTSVLLSPTSSFLNKPSQIVKPQVPAKTPGSHHCEVFLETIETTFPIDLTSSNRAMQQKRPTSTLITSPSSDSSLNINSLASSGLTTWPLKNKLNDVKRIADVSRTSAKTSQQEDITKALPAQDEKKTVMTGINSQCTYLDEVAREEERLINALKTGAVIAEEPERTMACLRTRQKPAIKQEKPKVEPVKQIIIGGHNYHGNNSTVSSSGASSSTNISNIGNVATVSTDHAVLANDAKSFSKDDLSAMSTIDYAKVRYQAAQQNPPTQQRLEEQRASNNPYNNSTTEQLVSNARTKFEMEIRKDKDIKNADKDTVTSRWGPRITSPRPRLEQAVPHPELTSQQKQHIRTAVATGTSNNPVRPFLTRGSVAERVLIFEKCPSELLLDKRGPRQPTINTWRGSHEVQNKAQVIFSILIKFLLKKFIRTFFFYCLH